MRKLSEEQTRLIMQKKMKKVLYYGLITLISLAVMTATILISIASDKKCNENHSAEFCRQQ